MAENFRLHRLATSGVPVEYRASDGSVRHTLAWLVDFEQPEANDWLVVNQFTVVENNVNKRPDVVLYVSQNFAFLSFPDELTTGSSIMPHKKNPDVFELIRARCNHLQSLPVQVSQLTASLPSGYHRDFQLLKEAVFPAIQHLKDCLGILAYALPQAQVNPHILEDERYRFLFSVEVVNELVLQGVPFREAYQQVGRQIEEGQFEPPQELRHSHEGSLGNLCLEEIERKMEKAMEGFPFGEVEAAIEALLR